MADSRTDTIDLHSLTVDEALKNTRRFLKEARAAGRQRVAIVTGRGEHSEDHNPKIKHEVQKLLNREKLKWEYSERGHRGRDNSGCIVVELRSAVDIALNSSAVGEAAASASSKATPQVPEELDLGAMSVKDAVSATSALLKRAKERGRESVLLLTERAGNKRLRDGAPVEKEILRTLERGQHRFEFQGDASSGHILVFVSK